MNIAVTAEGQDLNSKVSNSFQECEYLLIVNMTDLNVKVIKNDKTDDGQTLANEVIKYDCEAVITGELNPVVFDIIAAACVTRYLGNGYLVKESLDLMERRMLQFIKNQEGTEECDGDHHH